MNSPIKFLRRVRIHGGECGAVARALHHKARISLPAVTKNVFVTTIERTIMSKLSFKRVALAVVMTLGFGVLSSGPSSAAISANSDTLTQSATTSAISAGETASITIKQSFIAGGALESMAVTVSDESTPGALGNGSLSMLISESANVSARNTCAEVTIQDDCYGVALASLPSATTNIVGTIVSSAAGPATITWTLSLIKPTVVGTYVYRIYTTDAVGTSYTEVAPALTWTVTVTANASNVGAVNSKFWLNRAAEFNGHMTAAQANQNSNSLSYKVIETDSALVVSAGTPGSYAAVGVISPVVMNSSDTKISTQTGVRVNESMTITITGPGALRSYGSGNGAEGIGTNVSVGLSTALPSKSVTIGFNESAVVYSDGSAGVGTITAYIGGAALSTAALTQGTKSITFVGRATTFDVTGFTPGQRAGGNVKYAGLADSATASTATTPSMGAGYLPALRFVAKDAAGNVVTVKDLSTDKGDASTNLYAISSDTSIVAAGEVSATNTFATNTARRNAALTCSYDSVTAYWYCQGRVFDTGTVTLTIVDSRTITANGNSTTDTTHAVNKSAAFSVTFAGDANTGTIAFDKTAYNVNEKATLTLTAKDGAGRTVADASYTGLFTSLSWKGGAPTFGNDASANAAGGRFTDLVTYLGTTGPSFVGGTDTAMVYMPTVAGTYTLVGKTGTETTPRDLVTITVTDPAAAATLAAAEAATDAAAEAIDAANAATDAANLAAEAADAATVAAEEARDAADAATAAVEELATQVATLMAALKAQITTLANTVAKIAKKVKA
jgi:hypothetical protein